MIRIQEIVKSGNSYLKICLSDPNELYVLDSLFSQRFRVVDANSTELILERVL